MCDNEVSGRRAVCAARHAIVGMVTAALALANAAGAVTITVPDDYTTIQAAVDAADNGDEIVVKPGTYGGGINIDGKNLWLHSQGSPSPASIAATIIDGNGSVIVFDGSETPACIVEGFTIRNGFGQFGGGIAGQGTHATIRYNRITANNGYDPCGGIVNCCGDILFNEIDHNAGSGITFYESQGGRVFGNYIHHNTAKWNGGGVRGYYSRPTITSNTITANTATGQGHGIHMEESEFTVEDNVISGNGSASGGPGGGILAYYCDSGVIRRNQITSNTIGQYAAGGGVSLESSELLVENNVIAYNKGGNQSYGSGIHIGYASARLLHNTIARNTGGYGEGVAAYDLGYGGAVNSLVMRNNTVVGHVRGVALYEASSTLDIEGTLWGTGVWANTTDIHNPDGAMVTPSVVNIHGNPDFTDAPSGQFHIGAASTALEAGVDTTVADDFDRQPRPMGLRPDIGADERDGYGLILTKTADASVVNTGTTFTCVMSVTAYAVSPLPVATVLTDKLSPQEKALAVETDHGSYTVDGEWGSTITVTMGTLASGETALTTVTILTSAAAAVELPMAMVNVAEASTPGATSVRRELSVILQDCHCRVNDDPQEYTSVQDAIDAATADTDVVKVAGACTGVNTRGGSRQVAYVDKTLTLRGGYTPSTGRPRIPRPIRASSRGWATDAASA